MVITIDAKPEPVSINLKETVVLVVDMQNDFGTEGGMFSRAGMDISPIQGAVAATKKLLANTRRIGIPTIYIKMGFRPDLSDAGLPDSPNWIKHTGRIGTTMTDPHGRESRVLIRDTWNTEIVDDLRPIAEDRVIYKNRYSGFYATELHSVLQEGAIKYLIVTGCTTCVCVESTIRDAMFRNYHCVLPADCTAEPGRKEFPPENHNASLKIIQARFGWVTESETLISAFKEISRSTVGAVSL